MGLQQQQKKHSNWKRKKFQKSKKEVIELERYRKNKILNKYSKLCAAEGVQSTRVRVPNRGNEANETSTERGEETGEATTGTGNQRDQKKKKQNPFNKAELEAKLRRQQSVIEREERARITAEIEAKKKEKLEKSKIMTARTSKGQPRLGQQVSLLLSKLTKK